eukprot:NODE_165_length_16345_cov_0.329743.p4 type:complete len:374 gc:universal NODE_165_length_16345_cov_0.329743:2917-4038(+)
MASSFKTHLIALNWMLFFTLLAHVLVFGLHSAKSTSGAIAVIDAGSSGSRVHIFKLVNNKTITEIGEGLHKNPGLSKVSDIECYLKPFVEYILNTEGKIPVYVYATAGMRLLSDSEVKEKFDAVTKYFKSFNFPVFEIRIISGNEEGLFGFLSTMDLSEISSEKLGFIDMGGASMQISFVERKKDSMFVNFGKGLYVFSESWLRYGKNEAKIRHEDFLTKNSSICGVFNPCSLSSGPNFCIKPKINIQQCRFHLQELARQNNCTTLCHSNNPIKIPDGLQWFGASEFHYALHETVKNNIVNVKSTRSLVEQRCKVDITFDCFGAMWTLEILNILGITDINISSKIKNQEITWTRGFAFYHFFQHDSNLIKHLS